MVPSQVVERFCDLGVSIATSQVIGDDGKQKLRLAFGGFHSCVGEPLHVRIVGVEPGLNVRDVRVVGVGPGINVGGVGVVDTEPRLGRADIFIA